MQHIFSVDVEDWYNGFPPGYSVAAHPASRINYGMNFLLDILDEFGVKATFFWIGKQAKTYPILLRDTAARGHEIGCHSYDHTSIYLQSTCEFETDTKTAIDIISDIIGNNIHCYRAPYFSIRKDTYWALEILASLGITHDSSILPMRHWRTGMKDATDSVHTIETSGTTIIEAPITVRHFAGLKIPISGGGYFRAYPYWLTDRNFAHCEAENKPAVFYIHPWELDTDHPRINRHGIAESMHYIGIHSARLKLIRLLQDYSFGPLMKTADVLQHYENPFLADRKIFAPAILNTP